MLHCYPHVSAGGDREKLEQDKETDAGRDNRQSPSGNRRRRAQQEFLTRGLPECKLDVNDRNVLYSERGSALGESVQGSCGCPWIPESVQGQVGQGWEHPGLVEGVPAMAGVGMK